MRNKTTSHTSFVSLASAAAAFALVISPSAFAKSKASASDGGVIEQLKFKEGDETGNEIKALKTELLVSKSEAQALAQLKKLEKRYTGTPMEPDILLRRAELYMRRARTERFFEVHKSSEQILSFAPQLVKEASEAKQIRQAVELYEKIQSKFPNFRSMDVVVFNNAYARQQLGEDKEAERLFFKLIKNHPGSPLVPDSYLAVGEINFTRRNFTFALENFRAIRKYPQARAYPYGLYKAAWCYYNLQDANAGLKQLEEVVKFGRDIALAKADSKLDLRKEALGDMALFYGDVRLAKDAVDYFRNQAQELDAGPYVIRLVEIYKRHSRLSDIEIILKDVLKKMGESELVATAHDELIWNYEKLKNREGAGSQLVAFDKWCDAALAQLAKAKKQDPPPPAAECRTKVTEASKKLATKWHALWKKQGGPDDLAASSENAYRLFTKNADLKDAELPQVHFSYAELLFARGQFRAASENYAMLQTYQQKHSLKVDPKLAHDASYAAIVALEKANGDKWNDADEKQFISLSDVYVKAFPKGQYAFDLQFKRAFIAYEKERYDEAAPQFKKIGWTEIPAGQAVPEKMLKAQDLYLDILNIKKDYVTLKTAAQSLLGKGSATAGARVTQIEKIYREAYFAEIQTMEEKGDAHGAVEAYKKFALENKGAELAPKAWWNASQLQFKSGDVQGGAGTCHEMNKHFPKSPNVRDCLTKAAQTYETIGRLDQAAKVLMDLAEVETAKQAQWREVAADFFALSGDRSRGVAMYLKLAEDRKGPAQVALLEKAEAVAHQSNDTKTLSQIESKLLQMGVEPHSSRLVVEQAEEAFEKGDLTKAFNTSKKIIGRDQLPKDLLARARFIQARVLEDEYRKQSIKAKADRLGMVLAIKTEKLEKAQKAYQSAIAYKDPVMSVKALRQLADVYLDFSKSLRAIDLGGGVSEADLAALQGELEQIATPMEEKGIEGMNQALETAKKAQLREGQIAELQAEVNRLNMKTNSQPAVVIQSPGIYVPAFRGIASQGAER